MLRIKRSVAAAFSQQHFNTTIIDAAAVATGTAAPAAAADAGAKRKREGGDDMAALEAAATSGAAAPADALQPGTRVRGFVSAGIIQQGNDGEAGNGNGAPAAPANPEELDLGEEEGDVEEGGEALELEQQAVPDAVFGSLAVKRQKTDA
jgi:pre-mRNA-splicing factor SYF1